MKESVYVANKLCLTFLNSESKKKVYDEKKDTYENERKSEQAHIPHAPTLLENAVYNEWQFQALVTGNLTKKGDINCSSKGSNQHFL